MKKNKILQWPIVILKDEVKLTKYIMGRLAQSVTNIKFGKEYKYIWDVNFGMNMNMNIFVCWVLVEYGYEYWKYLNILLKSSNLRIFLK